LLFKSVVSLVLGLFGMKFAGIKDKSYFLKSVVFVFIAFFLNLFGSGDYSKDVYS